MIMIGSPARKALTKWAGVSMVVLGLAAAPAHAQTEDAGIDESETVVVTATKRSERLLDVPLSIDVIGARTIEDTDLEDPQDLALLTPGLQYSETIGRQTGSPAIRGVSPFAFSDPTVQVYVDGFTLGFTRNDNNATLFDLERIEVLKGPQATLYGRNALGGVINYITRQPSEVVEAYVRGEVGSYDSRNAGASISGPLLAHVLGARLGVAYRESGGFLDNTFDGAQDVNNESDLIVSGGLRWTPTADLAISLNANYSESDDACGDCSHVPASFGNPSLPASFLALGAGLVDINDFNRTVSQDHLGGYVRDQQSYVLNADYDMGSVTLTNILGWGQSSSTVGVDLNRIAGPSPFGAYFDLSIDNSGWSEELRLASDGQARFRWLIGFYAFNNRRHRVNLINGAVVQANSDIDLENYAGFINLDYDISDALTLGVGLRYDYEWSESINNLTGLRRDLDGEVWLPKFTAVYHAGERMSVYATVSRGYHAGGLNIPSAPNPAYEPEFIWNYEAGVRGNAADGRSGYDLAVYYLDWQDQQLQQTPGGFNTYIVNAGQSHILGLEASVFAEPVDGLTFSATLALQEARLDTYVDNVNAPRLGLNPDLGGNRLINVPDLSAAFSVQYMAPLAGAWQARLRADARYTGDYALDETNVGIVDAAFVANLYAGIQTERFEIGFFADNAFDEDYIIGGLIPSSTFPPLLTIGDPRIIGVRARLNY